MKSKEGIIVHLSAKEPLSDQRGKPVMINSSKQPLNEGYFFVDHPEHAPNICRIVKGAREATGFCLVRDGSEWTIHENNLKDKTLGLLHII